MIEVSKRPSAVRRDSVESKDVKSVRVQPRTSPAPETSADTSHDASPDSSPVFPWLVLLLAASGCAALIYEIVWFQLLQLVIGASAVSLGFLLAAYMGGLCLGSALFARFIPARENPLRIYAFLELGIAAFGLLALYGVPLVEKLYVATAFSGFFGMVWRGVIAALCLLPPTLLMGGSYPAISRWVERTPRQSSRLGLLYSANIAGAVVGTAAAGFWLLRVYDMAVTTWVAAAINVCVALFAMAIVSRSRTPAPATEPSLTSALRAPGAMLIYIAIGFSGLTALGAEVVWTRLLSLLLGPTVYTFSIILGVFLIGLCAGSSAGSFIARRVREPRLALALCQVLLAVAVAWTAWMVSSVLPYWPVDPWLSVSPWFTFDLDVMRTIRAILPATLLWGASFPLAIASCAAVGEDPARLSGEVYAANTAGSILGALAFSLLLIPAIGTQNSERLLIWLSLAGAAAALAPLVRMKPALTAKLVASAAASVALVWILSATVHSMPWQAIAYGRRIAPIMHDVLVAGDTNTTPLYIGEGVDSSVVITQRGDVRGFYVSGKSEASSSLLDMRLQRMMGHLPALIHSISPAAQSVLVVGFGAGTTAGSFVPYSDVSRIDICELEPLIPPASEKYFGNVNGHVLADPRTHVFYDDARHFILTSPDKYDIITTDPIHPWVKGTSTLYSKEYYEMVRSHLTSGGVAAQWLPIYESDAETVRTELATFFSVFPNATVWSNFLNGDGYDLVLIGSVDPVRININELESRLGQPSFAPVVKSLTEIGIDSVPDLIATYAGRAQDLSAFIGNTPVNNDLNMRLQFLAGMGVNSLSAPAVYREVLSYRTFPTDLITGSGDEMDLLRESIGRPRRIF